jgi:hypothetical protein
MYCVLENSSTILFLTEMSIGSLLVREALTFWSHTKNNIDTIQLVERIPLSIWSETGQ